MEKMKQSKKSFDPAVRMVMIGLTTLVSMSVGLFADLGLSTRFSDVILENLDIGKSYNLSTIKNLPLTMINTSSEEKEILIEIEAPTPEEVKPGYEEIPDPTWVKVVPDRFRLAAGARNLSDILINVPDDPKLIGRHFQVMFWAHTVDTGFLGVGVRVRVRFSVKSKSPEVTQMEIQKKKMTEFNFRLDPVTISAGEIVPGKPLDLKKERKVSIKFVNTGADDLKANLQCISYGDPQRPPNGYEAIPDEKWIEIEPKILDSKSDSIVPLKITLNVPDKPEYKDKKYAALINASLVGQDVPLNVYSQVLFTTGK